MRGYRRCSKKGKEVGERGRREFDEDNILESKTTRDCCLSLQSSKRLENCLLCKGGFLE